ncbi:MAG: Mu transposase C-terminal domain-containing protein [Pseudomonadota bacterium]
MTLERRTYQDVLDEALDRIKKENALRPRQIHLRPPTARTVRRLIHEIPAFDRVAARYGRTVAMHRFRSVQCFSVANQPLERAEIDHTRLDLIVIDDQTFMPLGRPWLTVCLDARTRCVLGIYLGFEPPSHLSVAACLRHAVLPKTTIRQEYPSIENEWIAHGVMQELVVDNGMEFHSASLENACLTLGIEIHYSARKTPWHKGKVERFLKSLNDSVAHSSPGTTFSNVLEKGDYDATKHAIVRLNTVQEIVRKWIVDVYHQRPHRAIGVPPHLDWATSIAEEDILLPEDPALLDAILGRVDTRTLTHKGIELDGLFYNAPELLYMRVRCGPKLTVELRIDDTDIGQIMVVCPKTGELYRVPALHYAYASGLSRWQHKVCKSYSRRILKAKQPDAWLKAKHDISGMVRDEFLVRGKGLRTRAARFKNAGDQRVLETEALEASSEASAFDDDVEAEQFWEESEDDSDLEYEPIRPVYRKRSRSPEEL